MPLLMFQRCSLQMRQAAKIGGEMAREEEEEGACLGETQVGISP